MGFKFEKLVVWQKSLEFSTKISELTRKFPREELWGLTSQIKRAADSIVLNIAEGSTGQTNVEYKRFLNYAIRSGVEVVACLYIAKNRKFLTQEGFKVFYSEVEEIIIMLQALRKAIS